MKTLTWRKSLLLLPVLLLALVPLALACGGGGGEGVEGEDRATASEEAELFVDPDAPVVDISLGDFFITPDVNEIAAGAVTFKTSNGGANEHELVIIKTDTPADQLPMASGEVDEEAAGEVIGEIEDLPAGHTQAGTFDLAPGQYAFICDYLGHYENGMFAQLTVE